MSVLNWFSLSYCLSLNFSTWFAYKTTMSWRACWLFTVNHRFILTWARLTLEISRSRRSSLTFSSLIECIIYVLLLRCQSLFWNIDGISIFSEKSKTRVFFDEKDFRRFSSRSTWRMSKIIRENSTENLRSSTVVHCNK